MEPNGVLLQLHGLIGAFALVVAPLAMVVRKGGAAHRLWGKAFFYGLVLLSATSIYLGFALDDQVMALVAVFSLHLAASGYRALYQKKLHKGMRPGRADLLLHGVPGLFYGGLLIWGLGTSLVGEATLLSYVFAVGGALGLGNVLRLYRRFRNPTIDRKQWFFDHMTGTLGAYLVTLTAFCAVNLTMLPVLLRWVLPLLVGVPLIMLWVAYYRRQFDRGKRIRHLADVRIP